MNGIHRELFWQPILSLSLVRRVSFATTTTSTRRARPGARVSHRRNVAAVHGVPREMAHGVAKTFDADAWLHPPRA